ncbi:uncharacterized protein [Temnothorax nylanderi]|uniref:uncharacterized protein n=1 Tax=Temnothorax nylanderi TaxID=102681 RepID=UPI003A8988FD
MLELEVKLKDERNIARAMVPFMPEKTLKQIRDKRNKACYKRWREQRLSSTLSNQEAVNEEDQQVDGAPLEVDEVLVGAEEIEDVFLDAEETPGNIYSFEESASTTNWRQASIEAVLKELNNSEPKETLEVQRHVVQLLTAKSEGQAITQEEVDTAYELVVSLFHAPATGKKGAQDTGESVSPSVESVKELYEGLWGSPGRCDVDQEKREATVPYNPEEILHPISSAEVLKRFRSTRLRVAAEPDGLRKGDLMRNEGGYILQAIFNVIMLALKQPSAWRCNRTTLLLNSPVKLRFLDEKIAGKLEIAKKGKGIVVTQVDIAKAFDSLPHPVIKYALLSKGLPEEVVALIMDSYKGVKTTMKCRNEAFEIELRRGVKQGDPLSPLIFNVSASRLMDELVGFLSRWGMALSIGKCVAFGIVTTKDSWYTVDPEIYSNGEKVAYCGPAQSMQYLGIQRSCNPSPSSSVGTGEQVKAPGACSQTWLATTVDQTDRRLQAQSQSRRIEEMGGAALPRYITALKLRANVAANKVSLNRVAKTGNVMCRKCKAQPETLGHILGQCTYTKSGRIKRHNDIQDYIEQHVLGQRGMAVTKEARLQDPHLRNLQPDLIIQYRERVFVADITICHEDGDLLERGRRDKLAKYASLVVPLKAQLGAKDCMILPIVIGTRGAMPRDTVSCLHELQIKDRGSLRTLTLQSLRSSVELFHMFMDYNAPLRLNSSDAAD